MTGRKKTVTRKKSVGRRKPTSEKGDVEIRRVPGELKEVVRARNWVGFSEVDPKRHREVLDAVKRAMKDLKHTNISQGNEFFYEDHPRHGTVRIEWRYEWKHPYGRPNSSKVGTTLKKRLKEVDGVEEVATIFSHYGAEESSTLVVVFINK